MKLSEQRILACCFGTLIFGCATLVPGCAIYSNLMHAVGADRIPPAYTDYESLEDCRLAIITMTDASAYGSDDAAEYFGRKLGQALQSELDDIELVRSDEIRQWRDRNGYDVIDAAEIGRGVKADKIIAVDIRDMTMLDGKSLYRGKAKVIVQVIDPSTGNELFVHDMDEFVFPVNAGQHVSETTESKFQRLYLTMLSQQVGRLFHPYDFADTVALDGVLASQ